MTKDTNTGYYNTGNYNTGDYNTGYRNTGDRNTGNYNTGYYNTGYGNTGDYNTGSWNKANHHTGCFNTVDPEKGYYFNKLVDNGLWDKAPKPSWLYQTSPTTWVEAADMTEAEKLENPTYVTTEGYLKVNDLKEEWLKAYASATEEEVQQVKDLPGFDPEVFLEITGIDLREPKVQICEDTLPDTVKLNGKVYRVLLQEVL